MTENYLEENLCIKMKIVPHPYFLKRFLSDAHLKDTNEILRIYKLQIHWQIKYFFLYKSFCYKYRGNFKLFSFEIDHCP